MWIIHHRPLLIADGSLVAAELQSPGTLHSWDVIFIPAHVFRGCIQHGALQPVIYLVCSSEGTRLAHAPEDTRGSQQGPRSQYIPSSKGKITEEMNTWTRQLVFVFKGCCAHAQRGRFAKIYKTAVFFGFKVFMTEPSIHLLSRGRNIPFNNNIQTYCWTLRSTPGVSGLQSKRISLHVNFSSNDNLQKTSDFFLSKTTNWLGREKWLLVVRAEYFTFIQGWNLLLHFLKLIANLKEKRKIYNVKKQRFTSARHRWNSQEAALDRESSCLGKIHCCHLGKDVGRLFFLLLTFLILQIQPEVTAIKCSELTWNPELPLTYGQK